DRPSGLLLSNAWGDTLRLWEPSSGQQLLCFPAGWSPWLYDRADGVLPVSKQNGDTKLRVLRLHPRRVYRTLSCSQAGAGGELLGHAPAFSADGRLLFAETNGTSSLGVALLDAATGRELARIPLAHEMPFHCEPGGRLLTCGRSGVLRWPWSA